MLVQGVVLINTGRGLQLDRESASEEARCLSSTSLESCSSRLRSRYHPTASGGGHDLARDRGSHADGGSCDDRPPVSVSAGNTPEVVD